MFPQVRSLTADDLGIEAGVVADDVEPLPDAAVEADTRKPIVIPANDPILELVRTAISDGYGGVIFVGPPGTSKSWYGIQIARFLVGDDPARYRTIQFHPSYQYEDFMEGYVPTGGGSFELKDKQFLELCKHARANSSNLYVMVIDEISRCDAARVFGEALTYLESSRRGEVFQLPSGRTCDIPQNLFVIATMNPWDRGVDDVDMALERRFAKIQMDPNPALLDKLLTANGVDAALRKRVTDFFAMLLRHPNTYCHIGHAYFMRVTDSKSLDRLWQFQLKAHLSKALRLDSAGFESIEAAWTRVVTEPTHTEATPRSAERG
ncbi:MAG TPA: AAA family ATPase [Gammaproteobacteria bacterium]|jgi:5-methylcytosine-specific restriction protein B